MPEPGQPAEPAPVHPAIGQMRGILRGVVVADPLAVRVWFVLDPLSGNPVVVCRGDAGETEDWVLFVPDEGEGSLQVAGKPRLLDPDRDGVCDRWRAYHGTVEEGRFFMLEVEWGRWGGSMLEAEDLRRPSVAVGVESKVLRTLNATGGLARRLVGGSPLAEHVAVGVDESGIDVRTGHGSVRTPHRIVRAWFDEPAADAAGVLAAVDQLVRRVGP